MAREMIPEFVKISTEISLTQVEGRPMEKFFKRRPSGTDLVDIREGTHIAIKGGNIALFKQVDQEFFNKYYHSKNSGRRFFIVPKDVVAVIIGNYDDIIGGYGVVGTVPPRNGAIPLITWLGKINR